MRNDTLLGIGITLGVTFVLGILSIFFMEEYGWTIFFWGPVLVGFLPPFIIGRKRQITIKQAYKYSFATFGLVIIFLLIFAIEGLVCIIMTLPLAAFAVWAGSTIGYYVQNKDRWDDTSVTSVIVLFSIGFLSFDTVNKPEG